MTFEIERIEHIFPLGAAVRGIRLDKVALDEDHDDAVLVVCYLLKAVLRNDGAEREDVLSAVLAFLLPQLGLEIIYKFVLLLHIVARVALVSLLCRIRDHDDDLVGAALQDILRGGHLLGRRGFGGGDIGERGERLKISAGQADHRADGDDRDRHALFGYVLGDKAKPWLDYPRMLALHDGLIEEHDEHGLQNYHREQGQEHAFRQHEAEVVTHAELHEEEGDKAAYRGQSAGGDGGERLGQRRDHRVARVKFDAQLFVIGMHEEDGIVHRQRQLQYGRAGGSYRGDGPHGVARDDIAAHVEQNGDAERGEEDERFEIGMRGEEQYEKHRHDRDRHENGHVAHRTCHEYARVFRRAAEIIAGLGGDGLADQSRRFLLVDVVVDYLFDPIERVDGHVVARGALQVKGEQICGHDRAVAQLGRFDIVFRRAVIYLLRHHGIDALDETADAAVAQLQDHVERAYPNVLADDGRAHLFAAPFGDVHGL